MLGLELGINADNLPESLLGIMAEQELLSPLVSSYLLNVERLRVAPTLNGAAVIRLEPPLIISQAECEQAMVAIERMAANLAKGHTATFLAHLVGAALPSISVREILPKAPLTSDPTRKEGRFAFLVHPLYLKNFTEFDESLQAFSEPELANLIWRWNDLVEPFLIAKARVTSITGQQAYGEFICVSRTSEELMNLPREQVLAELQAAVEFAKERGAGIVGLGAYTSVVSKGGRDLRNLGVALTTGNSYTVATAVEATLEATDRLGVPIEETVAAVVGATGSIGRAAALLLAERVNSLILIGNPDNREHSRRRLMKVCAEIYQYLNGHQVKNGGSLYQFVRSHPLVPAPEADFEEYQEFARLVADSAPIGYSFDLAGQLPLADVVLTATSQVNSLNYSGYAEVRGGGL